MRTRVRATGCSEGRAAVLRALRVRMHTPTALPALLSEPPGCTTTAGSTRTCGLRRWPFKMSRSQPHTFLGLQDERGKSKN
jgi:hypothetical protein